MSAELIEEKPEATAAPAKAKSKKTLILAGAGAAALLLGGGGAAFALMSGKSASAEESHAPAKEKPSSHQSGGEGDHGGGGSEDYVDVPPMVVNLRSPDGAARFLKLHFVLVPGESGNGAAIKDKLPALLDAFQPFLRELRPEDLSGSAAVFRVKEELLRRAIETMGDGAVRDVLIQDLIQQ